MKSLFDHSPEVFMKYSAGKTQIAYNIEEVKREDPEGQTVTEWQADTVIVQNPCDYPAIVSAIIRSRYTSDQVEAIVLNHGDGNPDHEAEYTALQQWRTEAKRIAKQVLAQK